MNIILLLGGLMLLVYNYYVGLFGVSKMWWLAIGMWLMVLAMLMDSLHWLYVLITVMSAICATIGAFRASSEAREFKPPF